MHKKLLIIALGAALAIPAMAQISVQIGIDLPLYPELQLVPGYPVYYAPQVQGNYFFYDGLYWEYEPSGWHVSSWYNGPWRGVGADQVPDFVLRVPLRYYRMPPRAGTMSGVPTGPAITATGTAGTAPASLRRRRCRPSSVPTAVTITRMPVRASNCSSNTATSRMTLSSASTCRRYAMNRS